MRRGSRLEDAPPHSEDGTPYLSAGRIRPLARVRRALQWLPPARRPQMMKTVVALLAIAWTTVGIASPADQTWTGRISDNLCNGSHEKMATGVFPPYDDHQCTLECLKSGGKYVLVDKDNKPIPIANQDFADLAAHAGEAVVVTGEMKGDAITVSKVEVAPKT
jgi:hypothetical protein